MYSSDYAYTFANGVDDKCYTDTRNCKRDYGGTPSNSWLYKLETAQWTISPDSSISVFYVDSTGSGAYTTTNGSKGVAPVVYLESGIKLQGNGTSTEPYKIIR